MGLVGLVGLMGGMGIRDGKRGDRIFTRLGKMFFRTGEEKGPGNRRKKGPLKPFFLCFIPKGVHFCEKKHLPGINILDNTIYSPQQCGLAP